MARPSTVAEFVLPAPLPCTEPGVSPPVVIKKVIPELGDLRGPEPGPAILELSVDRSGRVSSVRVIRGIAPAIDAKLIDAVSNWRFRPATQFGKPVDCVFPVSVLIDVR